MPDMSGSQGWCKGGAKRMGADCEVRPDISLLDFWE